MITAQACLRAIHGSAPYLRATTRSPRIGSAAEEDQLSERAPPTAKHPHSSAARHVAVLDLQRTHQEEVQAEARSAQEL